MHAGIPQGAAVIAEPAVIRIRRLTQTFTSPKGESFDAVESIDLDVGDGEFVAIVGPSGCGKSTLLNIISGLLAPTLGEVLVKGTPVTGVHDDIGYMPARDLLLPWRTVERNVEFPMEIRRQAQDERRHRAHELLAAVGLGGFERYYPHTLSQGMRQRVAIARTFATKPDVLLMDEPFSALDAQTRVTIQDLFLKIWEAEHRTVVLITHDVAEAVALADRVVVMSARPGTIRSVYDIDLPRPRSVEHLLFEEPQFQRYLQRIWRDLQH